MYRNLFLINLQVSFHVNFARCLRILFFIGHLKATDSDSSNQEHKIRLNIIIKTPK